VATLVPSLHRLFAEIDDVWPRRDRRTDGWYRACRWPANSSDHCPDSLGRVHAIDIDKDGINPDWLVSRIIHDSKPTNYVIWNRHIWSRAYGWRRRYYTGTSNPHTDHVHVSILHSDWARKFVKGSWGISGSTSGFGSAGGDDELDSSWNFASLFVSAGNNFLYYGNEENRIAAAIRSLRR
jgi:hypothetical protein